MATERRESELWKPGGLNPSTADIGDGRRPIRQDGNPQILLKSLKERPTSTPASMAIPTDPPARSIAGCLLPSPCACVADRPPVGASVVDDGGCRACSLEYHRYAPRVSRN